MISIASNINPTGAKLVASLENISSFSRSQRWIPFLLRSMDHAHWGLDPNEIPHFNLQEQACTQVLGLSLFNLIVIYPEAPKTWSC